MMLLSSVECKLTVDVILVRLFILQCCLLADMKGRCDFDSPRCDWEIGRNAPEQLIRWRGRTPTRSTGPSKDHTSKFKSMPTTINFLLIRKNT